MDKDLAMLAGYCMNRLSRTLITRTSRPIPFLMIWDKSPDRLKWAQFIIQKHMPGTKVVNISWQEKKGQGVIQFSGARARQFLRLIQPYLEDTPMRHLVTPP